MGLKMLHAQMRGLGPRFSNKGKISQPQGLFDHLGDLEKVETLRSELRSNKWLLRKTLGLTWSFVDPGWSSKQLIGNLRMAS